MSSCVAQYLYIFRGLYRPTRCSWVAGLNGGSLSRHLQFTAAVWIAVGLLDYLHYRSLVCAFSMRFALDLICVETVIINAM